MLTRSLFTALVFATPLVAQAPAPTPQDPFPAPIPEMEGAIRVNFVEFATIPDFSGAAPRVMHLVTEPGTRRMFALNMSGVLYSVSYDGKTVLEYMNFTDPRWGVRVQANGSERGVQSFAFHPQFAQTGTPGYGKFYIWTDSENIEPTPDFTPLGGARTHDTVLLEFTARTAAGATYDGAAPRELLRFQQPYANHNGGQLAFNPTAQPGSEDFGLLFMGIGDGGSGGDPNNHAQNLGNGFGKIFRLDPMGRNSTNGKYGIPASNPFVSDNNPQTLGEIYAYGVRNPQRFAWDSRGGVFYISDIGQNTVEKVSVVTKGANLGWNTWEGSYRFGGRGVTLEGPRSDPKVTYPLAEYAQLDPLLQNSSAASGLVVYRATTIPALSNLIIFGDNPSGEIFYVSADRLPTGGQAQVRRILFNDRGTPKKLLTLVQEKNTAQGKTPATRADMRLGVGPEGQVMVLNKRDGIIRMLAP